MRQTCEPREPSLHVQGELAPGSQVAPPQPGATASTPTTLSPSNPTPIDPIGG